MEGGGGVLKYFANKHDKYGTKNTRLFLTSSDNTSRFFGDLVYPLYSAFDIRKDPATIMSKTEKLRKKNAVHAIN